MTDDQPFISTSFVSILTYYQTQLSDGRRPFTRTSVRRRGLRVLLLVQMIANRIKCLLRRRPSAPFSASFGLQLEPCSKVQLAAFKPESPAALTRICMEPSGRKHGRWRRLFRSPMAPRPSTPCAAAAGPSTRRPVAHRPETTVRIVLSATISEHEKMNRQAPFRRCP